MLYVAFRTFRKLVFHTGPNSVCWVFCCYLLLNHDINKLIELYLNDSMFLYVHETKCSYQLFKLKISKQI